MKRLAMYSIKGGVGKTTAAVNLAYEAARSGSRVLLWDLDPQGAATFFFRVEPRMKGGAGRLVGRKGELSPHVRQCDVAGLHLVPADLSLRHLDVHLDRKFGDDDDADKTGGAAASRLDGLLDHAAGDYDVAVLDLPAGISLATEAVVGCVDALLVPTIPTPLSVRTLDQLVVLLGGAAQPALWPFVSMYDWRRALHRELLEHLADNDPPFFTSAVPISSAVERMGRVRQPLGQFAPRTTAAKSYRSLWAEVAARLWSV